MQPEQLAREHHICVLTARVSTWTVKRIDTRKQLNNLQANGALDNEGVLLGQFSCCGYFNEILHQSFLFAK
jgi:hypothetical protein